MKLSSLLYGIGLLFALAALVLSMIWSWSIGWKTGIIFCAGWCMVIARSCVRRAEAAEKDGR